MVTPAVRTVLFSNPRRALDGVSGLVSVCAVKKLLSSWRGPLVRVRRASDSVERDFYPTGDIISLSDITSWLAGTSGYFTKVYDQTGNGNDLAQTTTANQPSVAAVNAYSGVLPVTIDGVNNGVTVLKKLSYPAGRLHRRSLHQGQERHERLSGQSDSRPCPDAGRRSGLIEDIPNEQSLPSG